MATTLPLLILLLVAPTIHAVQHTVGGSSGWNTFVDYTTWAAGETFNVGDTLVFNYDSSHGVDEVTQANYNSCGTSNAIQTYSGGATTVALTSPGPMYFICPSAGHCLNGMKLAITVSNNASTSPPPTTPSTTSPVTPSPHTTASPPPPPKGEASGYGIMNQWMIGFSLVFAIALGFMG